MTNSTNSVDGNGGKPVTRNALIHGFYTSEVILPWESAEDFEELHADLESEFRPEGCAEKQAVADIARLFWLKRRVMRTTQIGFNKDPMSRYLEKSGKKSWPELMSYVREEGSASQSAVETIKKTGIDLKNACEELKGHISKVVSETKTLDTNSQFLSETTTKLEGLIMIMADFILPSAKPEASVTIAKTLEEAYAPDHLEKSIKLEAMIDARIDKALQRLASLKEFKRFEATKAAAKLLTNSPSIAPELNLSEPNAVNGNTEKVETVNPPSEAQPKDDKN